MARSSSPRTQYRFFRTFATRWRDNDVYGHMNNAVYYEYVDSVVNLWLSERAGLPVPRGPVICLVVESRCTFHASLAYPGEIEAGLCALKVGTSAITYGIGLFAAGTDTAAAEARFVHVCVDPETRAPVAIPEHLRAALAGLA